MITKTGAELKEAGYGLPIVGVGAVLGGARASKLSDKDIEALREYYDLPSDSNLVARSFGRGALGSAAGAVTGAVGSTLLGGALGHLAAGPAGALGGAILGGALSPVGAGIGGLAGMYLATNKYSKDRARDVRKRLGK